MSSYFIIFTLILLLILVLVTIFFGYIWFQFTLDPFYENQYNINFETAQLVTIIAGILLIIGFIVLGFAISYSSNESVAIGPIGKEIYRSPMYKTELSEQTKNELIQNWSKVMSVEEATAKLNAILCT